MDMQFGKQIMYVLSEFDHKKSSAAGGQNCHPESRHVPLLNQPARQGSVNEGYNGHQLVGDAAVFPPNYHMHQRLCYMIITIFIV